MRTKMSKITAICHTAENIVKTCNSKIGSISVKRDSEQYCVSFLSEYRNNRHKKRLLWTFRFITLLEVYSYIFCERMILGTNIFDRLAA